MLSKHIFASPGVSNIANIRPFFDPTAKFAVAAAVKFQTASEKEKVTTHFQLSLILFSVSFTTEIFLQY